MRSQTASYWIISIIAAASAALAFLPLPIGLDGNGRMAAGLLTLSIGLWATEAIPAHVTSLVFFLFAMLFKVAKPDVVFSGFASSVFWLVFGGQLIAAAIKTTGLGGRLARALLGRMGGSYCAIITSIFVAGTILCFLLPSSIGRVMMLSPVILALAERLGYAPHSRGRAGMMVAVGMVGYMPGITILPASVPTMVLIGAAESRYHEVFHYGEFLLWHFPVLGFLKCVAMAGIVSWLFADHPLQSTPKPIGRAEPDMRWSREEKCLAVLLAAALSLWATDSLHGVSPAWVALALGLFCVVPAFRLAPARQLSEGLNYNVLIYLAGIMALGPVAGDAGLGELLGRGVLSLLPLHPGQDVTNFAGLSGLAMLTGLVATEPGVPAVLTPLAQDLAQATGLPLHTVLMTQVLGFSTIFLPYQTPPVVIALAMGGVPLRRAAIPTIVIAILTIVVLAPLDFLWLRAIGAFG